MYTQVYISPPPSFRRKRRTRSLLNYISPSSSSTALGLQEDYDALLDALPIGKTRDLSHEMARLRVVKSVHEQKIMRKAADVSGWAHAKVCIQVRLLSLCSS